jgi:hypothetical protein
MADLAVTAVVTRTELGLENLDINDNLNYQLGRALRIGSVTWRRESVTSPYVHGRIPVHEVKDAAESSLVVHCFGETSAAAMTNLGVLLEAFTGQWDYSIALNVDGVNYQWRCERADYEVGFITETILAKLIPVSFTFHRHPIPLQGVF